MKITTPLAVVAAAALAATAAASSVEVRFASSVSTGGVYIEGTQSGAGTTRPLIATFNGSNFSNLFIGTLNLETGPAANARRLTTFCAEPTQGIALPGTYDHIDFESTAGYSASEVEFVEQLWFEKFDQTFDLVSATDRALEAAAFQMLIWEVALDDDIDFGNGNLQIDTSASTWSDSVAALAQDWYAAFLNDEWSGNRVTLRTLTSADSQDVFEVIPLPGAASMALVGIGVLAQRRRR